MNMLKQITAAVGKILGRAMNKGTMTCAVKGFAWMIAADGKIEDSEVITAHRKLETNEKLKVFGKEALVELDKAIDLWTESPRAARLDTTRAIQDWARTATFEDREDFLVAILDVMDGDGNQDPKELEVARSLANMVDLPLGNYIEA